MVQNIDMTVVVTLEDQVPSLFALDLVVVGFFLLRRMKFEELVEVVEKEEVEFRAWGLMEGHGFLDF